MAVIIVSVFGIQNLYIHEYEVFHYPVKKETNRRIYKSPQTLLCHNKEVVLSHDLRCHNQLSSYYREPLDKLKIKSVQSDTEE